jgi:hypothetical protein
MKMAVFWVVAPCSLVEVYQRIALMMEATRTSETLVNFYQTTRRFNPEDSHLRTHRRENLKSYYVCIMVSKKSVTLIIGHKKPPLKSILIQINTVNMFSLSLSNIYFNIVLPLTSVFTKLCVSQSQGNGTRRRNMCSE